PGVQPVALEKQAADRGPTHWRDWLQRQGRPKHDRRTISVAELRKLIDAAERGPKHRRMTGPARALCYRLAVATGLRYSEVGSITPGSFAWDAKSVRVAACYTKNGQTAVLPLPEDLALDLATFAAPLAPGEPVFPLPEKGAD